MKHFIAVTLVACAMSMAIAQQNEAPAKKNGHEMHKTRPQLATGAAFAPDCGLLGLMRVCNYSFKALVAKTLANGRLLKY